MDDRRILFWSILYWLVRWMLGLECHAGAARPEQGRRIAGVTARERRAAPTSRPGALQTRRPGVARGVVPVRATSPLGRDLPGHSRHAHGLAPQAGLAEMGLHRTPPSRTSPNRSSD